MPGIPAGTFLTSDIVRQFFTLVDQQIFSATGTDLYTPPQNAKFFLIECQGSGGAGGGAQAGTASNASVGSGGEGGAYAASWLTLDDIGGIGVAITVTVPAGGAGVSAAAGNVGAAASFGSLVSADGGAAGNILLNSSTISVQAGGTSTQAMTGQIQISGGAGGASRRDAGRAHGGRGGDSQLGNGGQDVAATTTGPNGRGYGGGGGGACNDTAGAAKTGGDGANGIVIVTAFG